ncbi:hypothetical protein M3Y94_01231900 [Aphelenchoides besseyi]|nr:hypothetical protein M3Y94_01231900 [Aphelenchoides besseyi]KAI6219636.1 Rab-GAP TBC domain-containing protein [Aphelenchoides besseyi]
MPDGANGVSHDSESTTSSIKPSWSVRDKTRQFEKLGAMNSSFSGDLRPQNRHVERTYGQNELVNGTRELTFDDRDVLVNRRRSGDDAYYRPSGQYSYNLQNSSIANDHGDPMEQSNSVISYYPGSPRSMTSSASLQINRSTFAHSTDRRVSNELNNSRIEHVIPEVIEPDRIQSVPTHEVRTIVAVPETDILDDSYTDEDDEVVAGCADDTHDVDNTLINESHQLPDSSSDEDDLEVRAQVEREEIVDRYDRGAEDEENIKHAADQWENPKFELYEKTDRYGFIHKDEIRENQEKKDRERERKRCMKWDRMFRDWQVRTPEKLAERIWKGVPDSYRLRIWRKLLAIDDLIERNGSTTYAELLIRGKLLSTEVRQIDVDVARTYRDHVMFMKRYDASQQSVFNVLVAYSMYNTEVGYCQGMNNLAAILLMYLGDEEAAFWGLHSLLTNRKYSMHGFFVPGFPKLVRFNAHLDRVLKKYLPKLHKNIEHEDIPDAYHAKWWFGIYIDRLPFSLAMRVWDVFLHVGDSILIAMAFNIMKMHIKVLARASLEVFMDTVQNRLPHDFGYPDDKVMESLRKCLEKLQDDKMALPPAPRDGETPELPMQKLGPILRRSMIDIRMDIAELHSRSSRTNSIAGRSPAQKPRRMANNQRGNMSPALGPTSSHDSSTSQPPANRTPTTNVDPFRRKPSLRNGRLTANAPPPPIPDADGFVPLSSTRNRHSFYDNVTPSTGSGGSLAAVAAGNQTIANGKHTRETSSDRVHRTANNVTYVDVGGNSSTIPPESPTPDYDDEEKSAPDFSTTVASRGFVQQSSITTTSRL